MHISRTLAGLVVALVALGVLTLTINYYITRNGRPRRRKP